MKKEKSTNIDLEKECDRLKKELKSLQQKEKLLIQSEINLISLINNQEESMWSIDKNYKYVIINDYFKKAFYSTYKINLKKGANVFDNQPQEMIDIWKPQYDKALNGERVIFEFTNHYLNSSKVFKVFLNPVIDNGQIHGVSALSIDITERKQTEEILKKNEAHLNEINATKDKFFSIIAHDLKNPFNSISGFSDLLADDISKKDYSNIEKYTKIIQESAHLTTNLLSNLLEWSRSQMGHINFNPAFFNLYPLINEEIKALHNLIQQKSIRLINHCKSDFEIFADPNMLCTIVRNLISNAIKFTPPKGVIHINTNTKNNQFIISIKDNGVGIAQNNLSKLFAIDQNFTTPGTEMENGTGLGLIICKEFIEKHGGHIWVESKINEGTEFIVSLPSSN